MPEGISHSEQVPTTPPQATETIGYGGAHAATPPWEQNQREQQEATRHAALITEMEKNKRVPSHENNASITPDPREFTKADQAQLDQDKAMGARWDKRDEIPDTKKTQEVAKHAADKIKADRYKKEWDTIIAGKVDWSLPPSEAFAVAEGLMHFENPEQTANVMRVIYEKAQQGDEAAQLAAINALGAFASQPFDIWDRDTERKLGRENQNTARTYIRMLAKESQNPHLKETAVTILGNGFDVTDIAPGKNHKALIRKIYTVANSTSDIRVRETAITQIQRYIDKPRTANIAARGYDALSSVQDFAKGVIDKLSPQPTSPTPQAA